MLQRPGLQSWNDHTPYDPAATSVPEGDLQLEIVKEVSKLGFAFEEIAESTLIEGIREIVGENDYLGQQGKNRLSSDRTGTGLDEGKSSRRRGTVKKFMFLKCILGIEDRCPLGNS